MSCDDLAAAAVPIAETNERSIFSASTGSDCR